MVLYPDTAQVNAISNVDDNNNVDKGLLIQERGESEKVLGSWNLEKGGSA